MKEYTNVVLNPKAKQVVRNQLFNECLMLVFQNSNAGTTLVVVIKNQIKEKCEKI